MWFTRLFVVIALSLASSMPALATDWISCRANTNDNIQITISWLCGCENSMVGPINLTIGNDNYAFTTNKTYNSNPSDFPRIPVYKTDYYNYDGEIRMRLMDSALTHNILVLKINESSSLSTPGTFELIFTTNDQTTTYKAPFSECVM